MRELPDGVLAGDWDLIPDGLKNALMECQHANSWPLYICGDTGRGKTFAMAGMYRNIQKRVVTWINFQPHVRHVMQWRSNPDRCQFSPEVIDDIGVLFLDDIGIRTDSEAQQEYLLEVLNHRTGTPTIISCNHPAERLHSVFDSRIASRLTSGMVVKMTGKDRRLTGTKFKEVSYE